MKLRGLQNRKVIFGELHKRGRTVTFAPGSVYSDKDDMAAESQLTAMKQIIGLMNEPIPIIEIIDPPEFMKYDGAAPNHAVWNLEVSELKENTSLTIGKHEFKFVSEKNPSSEGTQLKILSQTEDTLKTLEAAINNQNLRLPVTAKLAGPAKILLLAKEAGSLANATQVTSDAFKIVMLPGVNGNIYRSFRYKLQITEEIINSGAVTLDTGLSIINDYTIQRRTQTGSIIPCDIHVSTDEGLLTVKLIGSSDFSVGDILSIQCFE
jgi:hypothetical protein